jgi:hypothetical protein
LKYPKRQTPNKQAAVATWFGQLVTFVSSLSVIENRAMVESRIIYWLRLRVGLPESIFVNAPHCSELQVSQPFLDESTVEYFTVFSLLE